MDYEAVLKEKILPELERGRPNWDKPHTEAVVDILKALLANSPELNLDADVLIIAAYAHDWGYAGLFQNDQALDLKTVGVAKSTHMVIGGKKLTALLQDPAFDFLSSERKHRAVHLVEVHDKVDQLKDTDELVLMEADTLGGLDMERVKPSFDADSNARYMAGVKNTRFPKFITVYGKKTFAKLYKSREDFYKNNAS